MKKSINLRSILSMTALSAALAAALATAPAMAEHNESYQSVNNGWLSEYDALPAGTASTASERYRAVVGDNDTYGFIHQGWLSEYESKQGESMMVDASIHRSSRSLDWLGTTYWD